MVQGWPTDARGESPIGRLPPRMGEAVCRQAAWASRQPACLGAECSPALGPLKAGSTAAAIRPVWATPSASNHPIGGFPQIGYRRGVSHATMG
jgi:hypothetical protein